MYGAGLTDGKVPMHIKQFKPNSEKVMADLSLGVTVTGLYTLVAMGMIIAFT